MEGIGLLFVGLLLTLSPFLSSGCQRQHATEAPVLDAMEVRLAGGTDKSGSVEVLHEGVWGGICNFGKNQDVAAVVCRQLGFNFGTAINKKVYGTGRIWLGYLDCKGTEERINQCDSDNWDHYACEEPLNIWVYCGNGQSETEVADVRLAGGTVNSGRVEVLVHGEWGTICDHSFDHKDAAVVCRQLGYQYGLAMGSAYYGRVEDMYTAWFHEVRCNGDEASINECELTWQYFTCLHSWDATVACSNDPTATDSSAIRLAGGTDHSGRVEVLFNGEWGTVCSTIPYRSTATVVCRQLGFRFGTLVREPFFGAGDRVWLDYMFCDGDEQNIQECSLSQYGGHGCEYKKQTGVICSDDPNDSEVMGIRLANGTSSSGVVQTLSHGIWGTVCTQQFDDREATVVCRQLGFQSGVSTGGHVISEEAGQIWVKGLDCNGDESNISECGFTEERDYSCSSFRIDAMVECAE